MVLTLLGLGPDGLLLPHTSYLTKLIGSGMKGQLAFQLCPNDGTMWLGGFTLAADEVDGPDPATTLVHE